MQELVTPARALPPSPHITSRAYELTSHFQKLDINNTQSLDFSHLDSQDGGGNEILG